MSETAAPNVVEDHLDQPRQKAMSKVRNDLLALIKEHAIVEGHFTLPTGEESPFTCHVDLRVTGLSGRSASLLGEAMLDMVAHVDYQAIGGLALGAVPVACAMMHAAAARGRVVDSFVVRKVAKATGRRLRVEGPDLANRAVLVVEDTSFSGSSALAAVEAAQAVGARVVGVAIVVDRGGSRAVSAAGLPCYCLYTDADLETGRIRGRSSTRAPDDLRSMPRPTPP